MIVVDTNVLAYVVLPGALSAAARAIADRDPRLGRAFALALRAAQRTGNGNALPRPLAPAGGDRFRRCRKRGGRCGGEETTQQCLEVAARGRISAYDAELAAAAEALDVRLASADGRLAQAFPDHVVSQERLAAGDGGPRRSPTRTP